MKKMYLTYNNITGKYLLDYGKYGMEHRIELVSKSQQELINELKNQIDPKRKSLLYLENNLYKDLEKGLEKLVKTHKIEINPVKKIEGKDTA